MSAEKTELVVVGAGFAGLRAARAAARRGLHVTVLERKRVLGEPVRTSGASWLGSMRDLGIPAELYHPVRIARFYSESRTSRLDYPEPPGCILHVAEVVRFLAEEARDAGARIRVGEGAVGLLRDGERVFGVETPSGSLEARLTLDASGVANFLARRFGRPGFTRYGLGAEYTLVAPDWPQEEVAFWLGPPLAPCGYAWAFPEGGLRVRVGMGILRPDHLRSPKEALDSLLHSGREEIAPLAGCRVLERRTGAIPAQPAPLPLFGPGWLQVGDAASQASPLLGEGIRFCLEMGEVAGECAAAYLRSPSRRVRMHQLTRYAETWERRHGPKFRLEHRLNRRLSAMDGPGWDRALDLLESLKDSVPLDVLKGEWTPRALLGIFWRHPLLALRMAWGLSRG